MALNESTARVWPAETKLPRPEHQEKKHNFAVTIIRPPEEVFAFWRNFSNLPRFMKGLDDVKVLSSTQSHWVVRLNSGASAEWDAEIVEEIPGRKISWQSLEGSTVKTSGTVLFEKAPADRGTVVQLAMSYYVPGGKLTEIITKLTAEDPHNLILTNLRRLKAYLETGEIPSTRGQPSGRDEDETREK